jgi:hydrogenase maturation protease
MSLLVAGIGNIFLGDDAFGVEVAQRLARGDLPPGVRVVDFGIRGFDLAHALLEGDDAAILVDATPRGGAPGSLYVLEPDLDEPEPAAIETHAMDPVKVLRLARAMGTLPKRVLVVGCEPSPLEPDDYADGRMGLSEPVAAAIDQAVELVESLVTAEVVHASEKAN